MNKSNLSYILTAISISKAKQRRAIQKHSPLAITLVYPIDFFSHFAPYFATFGFNGQHLQPKATSKVFFFTPDSQVIWNPQNPLSLIKCGLKLKKVLSWDQLGLKSGLPSIKVKVLPSLPFTAL